jgi:propanediol dehydratase large subunit
MSNQLDLATRLDIHADAYTFASGLDEPRERALIDDLRLASERLRMLDELVTLLQRAMALAIKAHHARKEFNAEPDDFDKILEKIAGCKE